MTKEYNYIFTLLLKQVWGEGITPEETAELNEYKERSPYHKELVEKFGDIDWINNGLSQIESFPKEVIKQRIMATIEQSGNEGKPVATNYIEAIVSSNEYIQVHKNWRYLFLVLFILSKILLFILLYITIKYWKCIHAAGL